MAFEPDLHRFAARLAALPAAGAQGSFIDLADYGAVPVSGRAWREACGEAAGAGDATEAAGWVPTSRGWVLAAGRAVAALPLHLPCARLWVEVGCSNWELAADTLPPDACLVSFEPLVDKWAFYAAQQRTSEPKRRSTL